MSESQIDTLKNQVVSESALYEEDGRKDEVNLTDYLLVLWRWKLFILLCSLLPALVIGLISLLGPRKLKVTYTYDVKNQNAYYVSDLAGYDINNWNLDQNKYKILLSRFYSDENRNKINAKFQEYNPEAVSIGAWPSYIDIPKARLSDVAILKQIEQVSAQLLNITITETSKNGISKISSVIRDNFENIMPVYSVKDRLEVATRRLRAQIAAIEENRANMELDLVMNKAILEKLKSIKTKTPPTMESNITLQFDVSGKTEYLPVEYQIQAIESKTVQLEEQLVADAKTYNQYKDLLTLNEKLLGELNGRMSSRYTIQQFRLFLTDLVGGTEKKELKSFLNSYIKKIENRLSASIPIVENPKVYPVPRGTIKKTAIVFIGLLAICIFVTFVLESVRKS